MLKGGMREDGMVVVYEGFLLVDVRKDYREEICR